MRLKRLTLQRLISVLLLYPHSSGNAPVLAVPFPAFCASAAHIREPNTRIRKFPSTRPPMASPNPFGWRRTSAPESLGALRRSLEQLPSELLRPIAEGLVPARPLTTRLALRDSGTWEFRDASHQWTDWLVCHNNLLSFAQTSRRMAAIAKPLLYHTLVIPTPCALITLLRRMENNPSIKPWIRSVTCLVNVAGVVTIDEVHREWERQTGGRVVADASNTGSFIN